MSKITIAKAILRISGTILMFAVTLNFYIILVFAMFNNHEVGVYFNMFGEAKLEYVMFMLIAPVIAYSCYSHIQEFRVKKKIYKEQKRRMSNG